MWKPEHRHAAERHGLRYPSDLTDAEWALVGSVIPPARHGGRPRDVNVREVLNAILHPSRHDPHHAPALDQINSLPLNQNFLDRLLRFAPMIGNPTPQAALVLGLEFRCTWASIQA